MLVGWVVSSVVSFKDINQVHYAQGESAAVWIIKYTSTDMETAKYLNIFACGNFITLRRIKS